LTVTLLFQVANILLVVITSVFILKSIVVIYGRGGDTNCIIFVCFLKMLNRISCGHSKCSLGKDYIALSVSKANSELHYVLGSDAILGGW